MTYAGGSLSSTDLQLMHRADLMAERLIARIAEATKKKEVQPREFPEVPIPFMQEPHSEARLVRNFLLARKAHQMGLSLSDDDINHLLKQISNDALKSSEIEKEVQKIVEEDRGAIPPLSERALYAQLRINFLAQEMMALARNTTQSPMREMMSANTACRWARPAPAPSLPRRLGNCSAARSATPPWNCCRWKWRNSWPT